MERADPDGALFLAVFYGVAEEVIHYHLDQRSVPINRDVRPDAVFNGHAAVFSLAHKRLDRGLDYIFTQPEFTLFERQLAFFDTA